MGTKHDLKNEKCWENGGGKNFRHKHFDPRQLAAWNNRLAEIDLELASLRAKPASGSKKAKLELARERRHLLLKVGDTGTEDARRDKGFQNPNR